MEKSIKLECGCKFHLLEVDEWTSKGIDGSFMSLCIYEHKSGITGKLLKKPKLLADVLLHPEETELFKKKFLNRE